MVSYAFMYVFKMYLRGNAIWQMKLLVLLVTLGVTKAGLSVLKSSFPAVIAVYATSQLHTSIKARRDLGPTPLLKPAVDSTY